MDRLGGPAPADDLRPDGTAELPHGRRHRRRGARGRRDGDPAHAHPGWSPLRAAARPGGPPRELIRSRPGDRAPITRTPFPPPPVGGRARRTLRARAHEDADRHAAAFPVPDLAAAQAYVPDESTGDARATQHARVPLAVAHHELPVVGGGRPDHFSRRRWRPAPVLRPAPPLGPGPPPGPAQVNNVPPGPAGPRGTHRAPVPARRPGGRPPRVGSPRSSPPAAPG